MSSKKHLSFTSLRRAMSKIYRAIPDKRQKGKIDYSLHDALMCGFACMHFQDPSLLQFQKRMEEEQHNCNLRTLFDVEGIPKETRMREILDGIDSDYFEPIFKEYYQRLQRGKHLEPYQLLPGYYYFPIDGSQFYHSNKIHCENCLVKEHKKGPTSYSHQVLQGGIMHPDQSEVIPFMPEEISNANGGSKQDGEMNAAKRLLSRLRKSHPRLGLIIGGDALFSKQPIIQNVLSENMHYIFAAKPTDHRYLFEWIEAFDELPRYEWTDKKGRLHVYEWQNNVPLNGKKDTVLVNFFSCKMIEKAKDDHEKIVYKNSWVSDLPLNNKNIKTMVAGARCRWKNENECFNVMKNHGYYMDRNYGHGKKHLCFNFYLLTLLAFFFHQIFELTDKAYQACRQKFGSKKHLWEKLRAYIDIIIFETWESLLAFALADKRGLLVWANGPPHV